MLGVDDRLLSVGQIAFAPRPSARMSREAAERVSGYGLLIRSGTVSAVAP